MRTSSLWFSEPYRIFFPAGIVCLLTGLLIWVPQIWNSGEYPVGLHRFLLLNGFVACFISGFLMTAVPRFSNTIKARSFEVVFFLSITSIGIGMAVFEREKGLFYVSAIQAASILAFLFSRIFKRKENPPYSFIFIFVGLILWLVSALASIHGDGEYFKRVHYEGAIAAIILGVGSRLIPGILGHVEIVQSQRKVYEQKKPLLSTVPLHFFVLIAVFVLSYFGDFPWGDSLRAAVVLIVSFLYWKIYQLPHDKTALTYSLWATSWAIVLGFMLKAIWKDGGIHASHAFFINGIVLICLLVATRVLQSHGPQDKGVENWRGLYVLSVLVFLSTATRVSAYLLPESYLTHLGYSSILLSVAVALWSWKYIRMAMIFPSK